MGRPFTRASKGVTVLVCTLLTLSFFSGCQAELYRTFGSTVERGGFYVVAIVMENRNYGDVIGNLVDAPYINRLASNYSLATDYFDASSNFSLPNYLGLIAGDTYSSWSACNVPPYACPNWTPIKNPTLIDL